MSFETRELFKALDFKEAWDAYSDELPGYQYARNGIEITAAQVVSNYLRPCFLILGLARNQRAFKEIQFEMPLSIESYEQGIAWLVYGIGCDFQWINPPHWFSQGLTHQETLPWIRRLRTYEQRPICIIEREWFKLASKQLRKYAAEAITEELATFHFDGSVLRIEAGPLKLAMPATGAVWPHSYGIKAINLDHLPQRYSNPTVHISVFDGRFSVDNRTWEVIENLVSEK